MTDSEPIETDNKLIDRLKTIETFKSSFRQSSKGKFSLYYGTSDGIKIGVVLASKNPRYETFSLNKHDLELAVKAKANGKIDKAFVMEVEWVIPFEKQVAKEVADAEAVYAKWKDRPTRIGMYGEFWTSPSFCCDEEPF